MICNISQLYDSSFTVSSANYSICRVFPCACLLCGYYWTCFCSFSIHRLIKVMDWTEILRKALVLSSNALIFILATALCASKQPSILCMCFGKGRNESTECKIWAALLKFFPSLLSRLHLQVLCKQEKQGMAAHSSGVWSDSWLVRKSVLTQTESC